MNHITQAKRALRDLLIERLPLKLQLADGQCGDGIKTPVPAKVHTTDKADLEDYPALELIVTSSQSMRDSTAQVYKHNVVIGFTLVGDDEETLTAQDERYMWALRQVCRDTLFDPPIGTGPIDTGGEQYTPLAQRPQGLESPFVKGGYIEVFVTTVE